MEAASPPKPVAQQPAAGSQGDVQAAGGTSSEKGLSQEQADSEVAAAAAAAGKRRHEPDDDSESDADSEPGSKRARIQGQPQPGAAAAIPQAPAAAAAGAVKTEDAAEAPDAAAAVAEAAGAAGAAAPMAASAMALTPEQQQNMLQSFSMLTPEALAAAQAALPTGPDGQPLPVTLPLIGPSGESLPSLVLDPSVILSGQIMGPNGEELTQEQVASLLASAAQMQFIIPLAAGQALPGGGVVPAATDARSPFKSWWDAQEEKELVSLVEDKEARLRTFGSRELDWGRIEAHFGGRSLNACRKKYWQLAKKAGQESDSEPELIPVDPGRKPRADRKLWEPEETQELLQLVNEPAARTRVLGLPRATTEPEWWEAIAMHFECSVQTCKRKYRSATEAQQKGTLVQPGQEKAKRRHHRKKTPYRWMIVNSLMALPNGQGTAPDIFEQIEANPDYAPQLDTRIMPGTKNVPRWRIQVRKVLSADRVFQHTGLKQKTETVWRLDQHELREAQSSSKAVIGPHPAAQVLAGLGAPPAAAAAAGAAAAAAAGAGAGRPDGPPLSPQQIQAAMDQLSSGTVFAAAGGMSAAGAVPAEMAAEMALVQQQIAATIAAGPLAVSPEQLQEIAKAQASGDLQQLAHPGSSAQQAQQGAEQVQPEAILSSAAALNPAAAAAMAVGPPPGNAAPGSLLQGQSLPGTPLPGQPLPGQPQPGHPLEAAAMPVEALPGAAVGPEQLPGLEPLPGGAEELPADLALPLLQPLEVEVPAPLDDIEVPAGLDDVPAGSLSDGSEGGL